MYNFCINLVIFYRQATKICFNYLTATDLHDNRKSLCQFDSLNTSIKWKIVVSNLQNCGGSTKNALFVLKSHFCSSTFSLQNKTHKIIGAKKQFFAIHHFLEI